MSRTTDETSAPLVQPLQPAEPLNSLPAALLPDYEAMVHLDVLAILDSFINGDDLSECAARVNRSTAWLRKELAKEPARLLVAQREREIVTQRGRKALNRLVTISTQEGSVAAAESAARFLAESAGLGAKSAAARKSNSQAARSVTVKLIRSGERGVSAKASNSIEVRVGDALEADEMASDVGSAIEAEYQEIDE